MWRKWVIANPLLRFHLLSVSRWLVRRPTSHMVLIVLTFVVIYLRLFWWSLWSTATFFLLAAEVLVLCLVTPLMTHSLFAAEFEKRTWDMLVLTRLSASQIVMGKFLSRLVLIVALAALFLLLIVESASEDPEILIRPFWLLWLLKTQWVIVSWAALLAAITLWLSFRLKRGMLTSAVVVAGQFFLLVGLPFLILELDYLLGWNYFEQFWFNPELYHPYAWFIDLRGVIWFYNPGITLFFMYLAPYISPFPSLWGIWQGLGYWLFAVLMLAVLIRSVAKAARKAVW